MRGSWNRLVRYGGLLLFVTLLTGCPLAFQYSGEGAAGTLERDPSSPDVTSMVSFSYTQSDGPNGSIADGAAASTISDTTLTLATATDNAVIYYTDDGTSISDFESAKRIDGSSGDVDVRIADPLPGGDTKTVEISAIAVGPGMRPSPETSVTVTVDYPLLHRAVISEVGVDLDAVGQAETRVVLYALRIDVEGEISNFTGLTIEIGGTADQYDFRRLQLWGSDDPVLDGTDLLYSSAFDTNGYTSGTRVTLGADTDLDPETHFLLVSTTVDSIATPGNTVSIGPVALADIGLPDTPSVEGPDPLPAGPTAQIVDGTNQYAMVGSRTYFSRRFSLSNITINGVQATDVTVPVGDPVTFAFDFASEQAGTFCPGCVVQAYAGIRGVAGQCVADFGGYSTTTSGSQLTFTPTEPGLYYLTLGGSLDFNCLANPENRVSYFDGDLNFAVVRAQ